VATEFWARLEDASGRVVGPDPAWTPQRQFLWDVVHDTRGILRGDAVLSDLELIRKIDRAPGVGGAAFALDPNEVRRVYTMLFDRSKAHEAKFRLVATEGRDDWAAVKFFEEAGAEYAIVGGWTGPFLRTIAPEPDQRTIEEGHVAVGGQQFEVRSVPYSEYFSKDFETLLALLSDAAARGLRVRFLQR
jgi:hypothetical protein